MWDGKGKGISLILWGLGNLVRHDLDDNLFKRKLLEINTLDRMFNEYSS